MGRKDLHPVQQKLLQLLRSNLAEPLTIREMQEALDVSSTSVVVHHLQQLERKGIIKRNPSNPRDFHVMEDGPEPDVAWLNVYGLARCGPGGSILDGTPIDRIAISPRLFSFPAAEAFIVKAKGRSMEPKIFEGDLVIARKGDDLVDGKIYVCVNDEECLIKRVRRADQRVILESINRDAFPPFLAADDFRIEGEVRNIISGKI